MKVTPLNQLTLKANHPCLHLHKRYLEQISIIADTLFFVGWPTILDRRPADRLSTSAVSSTLNHNQA